MKPETLPPESKRLRYLTAILILVVIGALVAVMLQMNHKSPVAISEVIIPGEPLVRPNLVATGLKMPTGIVGSEDGGLFVLEQAGTIRKINSSGQVEAQPFLDIQSRVLTGTEMGLLGLAFHPKYQENGYLYVNYIDKSQDTVIARYQVPTGTNTADPSTEKILFSVKQPYPNHNGGDLVFGPDGYLYIALGDGGSGGDPENRAQNKAEYLGKILRIDVDSGDPYATPPTNPFVSEQGTKPEIWAYGLRNPWRISFDRETNNLYIADVGQGKLEEIDVQRSDSKGGENYGWRCYEGNQTYNASACKDASQYTAPVLEYDHNDGKCSITGGYVYRGSKYPALTGKYLYGDYCSGQLFSTSEEAKWVGTEAAKTPYAISAFGQGSDGEVYFADFKTGSIYHIQDIAN